MMEERFLMVRMVNSSAFMKSSSRILASINMYLKSSYKVSSTRSIITSSSGFYIKRLKIVRNFTAKSFSSNALSTWTKSNVMNFRASFTLSPIKISWIMSEIELISSGNSALAVEMYFYSTSKITANLICSYFASFGSSSGSVIFLGFL